ncbi:hypothetical protein GCM10009122_24140 [Fulvivirga kasyanovii]
MASYYLKENLDIVLSLLNRLNEKSKPKYRLFSDSLTKIEGILNSKSVMYSIMPDGKIYKLVFLLIKVEAFRT